MMKMTGAALPLIDNEPLYNVIKSGIRGGICGICEKKSAEETEKTSILYIRNGG